MSQEWGGRETEEDIIPVWVKYVCSFLEMGLLGYFSLSHSFWLFPEVLYLS